MASALEVGASLFGSVHEDVRCILQIGGLEGVAVRVARYETQEKLSALFRYEIDVATDPRDVAKLENDALGAEASFTLQRQGSTERIAHGIITEVHPDGTLIGLRQARTTLILEPRLANLRYSGGFRIFQEKTVGDIIQELVAPERIQVTFRLRGELAVRDYTTQFDESDLEFLQRLAADEGLHYFFEHDDQKTSLVFTNSPLGFPDLAEDAEFDFRDAEGMITGEHVRAIQRARRVRTGALEHRDYDFQNPHLELVGRQETPEPQTEANTKRRERREYPGAFIHPEGEGVPRARMRLEALRSDAATLQGQASTLRLLAGRAFTLKGHRDKAFNQRLVVTQVSFGGEVDGGGEKDGGRASASFAAFDAVPSDVPIRPVRRKKPASQLQIAKIVGPKEGDPFVDEYGRVKVQFPWDRDGKFDEHSSCWIRSMTPLAFDDEGQSSAHKVGAEVLVDFVNGDIDRPVVLGALYNGRQKQPYKQPDKATHSTWKVRSIPGGKGYNEITFENGAGKEKIVVHGERDRDTKIGRNDTETIGANQTITVGANQTETVGANRTTTIGANDTTTVGANRTETVLKAEDVTVKKGRVHTVEDGNDVLNVTNSDRVVNVPVGNHTRNVKLLDKTEADNVEVHARYDVHVTGDRKVEFRQGETVATFEDNHVELHAAGRVLIHHGDSRFLIEENSKITIDAEPELEANCAGAQIKMGQGKASLIAPVEAVIAVGDTGLKLSAEGWELGGAKGKLTAATGIIEVAGLLVKIN